MGRTLAIAGLLLGMVPATLMAQEGRMREMNVYGPQQGDWELILGAGAVNDVEFGSGSFNLNASIGYFVTKDIEVVFRQGISFADIADESAWNFNSRVALDYHFDLDRFRPFVGVNFGGVYGELVDDSFAGGLEAGVKWYALPKTFIFGIVEYQWLFNGGGDISDGNNSFSDGQFVYTVGIGFNF